MIIYIICSLISLIIFLYYEKISSLINIYDHPDTERKLHKRPISLSGSIFLISNISIYLFYTFFFNDLENSDILNKKRDFFFLVSSLVALYFLGLLDDKYNINPWIRLGVASFFIILIMLSDSTMVIKILYFKYANNTYQINLDNLSIFLTLICFIAYLNAINMFDGINLQLGIYVFFISIYLIFNKVFIELNIILLISLIPFLILNYKNKTFIGNSGTNLIAFIYGYQYIKGYNYGYLNIDIILLLNYLITLDLLRVFTIRVFNGKNPFIADQNHIHHILLKKINYPNVVLINTTLAILPIILSIYFSNNFVLLIFFIIIYFVMIYFFKNLKNKSI